MRTKQEVTGTLLELMADLGVSATERDLRDFDLTGAETDSELEGYARDWASEEHSNRCEAKNAWRYEH